MKTKISIMLLFAFICNVNAQEEDIQKLNLKVYYSPVLYGKTTSQNFNYAFFGINPNYKISELWEVGGFASFSLIKVITNYQVLDDGVHLSISNSISGAEIFGLNANFHVLPLLMETKNLRYDVYVTGKLGGFYVNKQNNWDYPNGIIPEFSIGTGFSVNFTKHFGVFGEYNYGKFARFNHRWEYGIEVIF